MHIESLYCASVPDVGEGVEACLFITSTVLV